MSRDQPTPDEVQEALDNLAHLTADPEGPVDYAEDVAVLAAALAAQQPQPVVQAFHGDDPARPARDDDPVHDAGAGE